MSLSSYEDWVSIYNQEIKGVWEEERKELRKVAMIYCAFQLELDRVKDYLSNELSIVKSELKKRDFLQKCKNFKGLAESEYFGELIEPEKENKTPEHVPFRKIDLNSIKSEEFFIESPNTAAFVQQRSPPPTPRQNETATSPVINKNRFGRSKRKNSTSPSCLPPLVIDKTPKLEITKSHEFKTPKDCNDSNIMECSIIENTPNIKSTKRAKMSLLKSRTNKSKLNKSKQATTLTQMFLKPRKQKQVDSNLASMSINEMIDLINESSSDADTDESDATVDNLELPQPEEQVPEDLATFVEKYDKIPEKKDGDSKFAYEEVVRGKERKKLKGWSCKECQAYYECLNLPPEELEKKKNDCSRHRHKFQPREETYAGFWDLTFGPSPKTQETEESIVFNYKKSS
jgi:hypothetical protein